MVSSVTHSTVLLIEDDPQDQDLVCDAFKKWGKEFQVIRADSFQKAASIISDEKIDLILLDLSLPDVWGIDAVNVVLEAAPNVALVVLTDLDDEQAAMEALTLGAQEFLLKREIEPTILPRVSRYAIRQNEMELMLREYSSRLEQLVMERTKELEEKSMTLDLMIQETRDYAIYRLNPDGLIASWNKGGERIYGLTYHNAIGRPLLELLTEDSSRLRLEQYLLHGSKVGGTRFRSERHCKGGKVKLVETTVTALLSRDHHLKGYLVVDRDLSELDEAEKRASQAERLASLGEVISGIAHESRNALQRIQSLTNRIRRREKKGELPGEFLDGLDESTKELSMLYERVKEFARPIHVSHERLSLTKLLQAVYSDVKLAYESSLSSSFRLIPDEEIFLVGDPFLLRRAFANIIENSFQAAKDSVTIQTSIHRESGILRMQISDDGEGLTGGGERDLFRPFATTKRRGTGLGLAFARRVFEAHGGLVRYSGADDDGQFESLPGFKLHIELPEQQIE